MGAAILIVDDDAINRKLLRVTLSAFGFEVTEAENGRQAVELAIDTTPALILMDIQMPVLNGIEALRMLKTEPAAHKIPVVALTAYAMEGDKDKFLAEGFDAFLSKPIDIDETIETINRCIRDRLQQE